MKRRYATIILRIIVRIRVLFNRIMMKYFMSDTSISHVSMFHNIIQSGKGCMDPNDCEIENLIDYIEYCHESGIRFVTAEELFSTNPQVAKRNMAIITFDDGFESLYSVVNRELSGRGIPFLCFITTSYIGEKGYISKEQLIELSQNPLCTIGMHADQHIQWRNEESDKITQDYNKCKEILSHIIGYEPQYYAFPYGSVLAVSRRNIKDIGKMNPKAIFLTDQRKLSLRLLRNAQKGLPRLDIAGYYSGLYREEYRGLKIGEKDQSNNYRSTRND